MAKAKLVFVLLVAALFSISIVMATETQNLLDTNGYGPGSLKSYRKFHCDQDIPPNAHHSAQGDVARRSTTNPACSSVKNAVPSASASLRGSMGTRLYALATITGRPRAEDPNAPKILPLIYNFGCHGGWRKFENFEVEDELLLVWWVEA
ncbi:hypothetical protein WN944_013804 [Citrus x changshan-huyou]|uniref:Uncharacterized protein n=1 Tax=Citrus x changshan-huyou TaxID=2935761 RepID=A0AAP0QI80_9ROSI